LSEHGYEWNVFEQKIFILKSQYSLILLFIFYKKYIFIWKNSFLNELSLGFINYYQNNSIFIISIFLKLYCDIIKIF